MPLIQKEDRREEEALRVRLQPAVAEQLKAYAQFSESSEGYIINAALERLFAADKEFKEFLAEHPNAGKPQTEAEKPVVMKPRKRRSDASEDPTALAV